MHRTLARLFGRRSLDPLRSVDPASEQLHALRKARGTRPLADREAVVSLLLAAGFVVSAVVLWLALPTSREASPLVYAGLDRGLRRGHHRRVRRRADDRRAERARRSSPCCSSCRPSRCRWPSPPARCSGRSSRAARRGARCTARSCWRWSTRGTRSARRWCWPPPVRPTRAGSTRRCTSWRCRSTSSAAPAR